MYLPLESTTPIFLGGLARRLVDWKRGNESESDAGPGVLFSSGLVAGGSIMGLAASFLSAPELRGAAEALAFGREALPAVVGFAAFVGLAALLYRRAIRTGA
jgi:hypothetical protein